MEKMIFLQIHTIDKTGHRTAEKQIENSIDIRF